LLLPKLRVPRSTYCVLGAGFCTLAKSVASVLTGLGMYDKMHTMVNLRVGWYV
jgi:hypothetical protein